MSDSPPVAVAKFILIKKNAKSNRHIGMIEKFYRVVIVRNFVQHKMSESDFSPPPKKKPKKPLVLEGKPFNSADFMKPN